MLGTLLLRSETTHDGCWVLFGGGRLDSGTAPPTHFDGRRRRNLRIVLWEYLTGEKVSNGRTVVTTCHRRMCWRPSHLVVKSTTTVADWFNVDLPPARLLRCSTCDGPLAEHRVGQCVPLTGPARSDPTMTVRRLHARL